MGQLTPQFLMDLESRMRVVANRDYARLNARTWWSKIAKKTTITGKRERLIWLLDSAKIEYVNRLGGEVTFEDVLAQYLELEYKAATAGLQLNRFQLDDHNGGGVELAKQWSASMGEYAAYWPQKQVALAIKNGATAGFVAYDGQVFFSNAHPLNPFETAYGTYSNIHTGGSGAGAVPIGGATPLDTAFENINKVFSYIQTIKMPNGEDPRNLFQACLLVPPALGMRAQQLTNAKFIAQAASSGGGSGDVEAVIRYWSIGEPIIAPELSAATGGSDTDYYVGVEMVGDSEVGALNYGEREPFQILYNNQMTDAQLARANNLQWLTRGANVVSYGHPFLLHKCRAT